MWIPAGAIFLTAIVAGLQLTAENLAGRRNKLGTVLIERVPAQARKKD